MSTVRVINVVHPSSATNNIVLDSSGNASVGGTMAMSSSFMRNRIINGAMVIDQRNAGAAVNGNGGNYTWPVDRFYSQVYNTTGNTTGQQSSVAPTGFTNSMKISVQTADTSVGATDQVWYGQTIEGYNIADFGFGAADAATITLSFWVYSNVTGTYCVTFKNSAQNRGYTAEYTISASNTWEKKTITVAGDTTGTWLTTNGAGLNIWFVLMAGSSQQTTANTWNATSGSIATSNQVNFMSSTSNAWYITGVQLEVGSVATPFEREIYSNTLQKCQRYFLKYGAPNSGITYPSMCMVAWYASNRAIGTMTLPVPMRVQPTLVNNSYKLWVGTSPIGIPSSIGCNSGNTPGGSVHCVELDIYLSSGTGSSGQAGQFKAENNTAATVTLDAEL